MSSRALRKLQGGGDKDDPMGAVGGGQQEQGVDEDLGMARGAKPRRPNLNPFELVSYA